MTEVFGTIWRPIDTAPKDGTKILLAGKWKPFDILPGGENYIGLAAWSSLMSDGTSGYQWYLDFLTPIDNVNVDFTHWMPLPEPPVTSGIRNSKEG